jgi:hypothetical protein
VEVAGGFVWSENLFMTANNMYVSENHITGTENSTVWRIFKESPNALNYTKAMHISAANGFHRTLGIVGLPSSPDTIYIAAEYRRGSDFTYVILKASSTFPDQFTSLATLPKCGNGLRAHIKTNTLFVSSEGDFLPGSGAVYAVDIATGAVKTLKNNGFTDDGLWVDNEKDILYVGEFATRKIWAYDIALQKEIGWLHGPAAGILDDFTTGNNIDGRTSDLLFGSNWLDNRIDVWSVSNGTQYASLVAGQVQYPTSCRFGTGGDFSDTSLFITEGGFTPVHKVWEIKL